MSVDTHDALDRFCSTAGDAGPAPATLFIVAHPDDEVIGAGARLARLPAVTILTVTDGAPRDGRDAAEHGFATAEEYASARRRELLNALEMVGTSESELGRLGAADQQVSFQMEHVAHQVMGVIDELRPKVVVTHPYEGGHPDHDAVAFAVHAACACIERDAGVPPLILEMTSYHNSPSGIETGTFFPGTSLDERALVLSAAEQDLKCRMLGCFATQAETLQYFRKDIERFRHAPVYDFSRPPHEGVLFYEMFPWGMTGSRFCELAVAAIDELGLSGRI